MHYILSVSDLYTFFLEGIGDFSVQSVKKTGIVKAVNYINS